MAKVLTTSGLIKSIKRRAQLPTNQNTFKEEDFIDMINEEIKVGLLPHILKVHEEHYVVSEDQPLLIDQRRYEIPYRAIGNKLRDLSFIDTSGNTYELSRISLEELSDYENSYSSQNRNVFYVENTDVVLPNSSYSQTGTLRFYFYLSPNELVSEGLTTTITSIDRSTGTITLSEFPEDFATLPLMDFIGKRSPCKILGYDVVPVSINRTSRTVVVSPDSIPERLTVGDYVCKAEESPVTQMPVELQPVIAQRVACHCLEALGDTEGLASALRKLQSIEENTLYLIDDRVEGAPQKVKSRHGTLREATGKRVRKSGY